MAGLQAQLAELHTKAQTAGRHHGTAVDVLDRQLDEASNAGIHNKKWYQKLGDFLVKAWDFVVTISKWVVAIGGILLLFLGGPLVWIVLAAALLVLADTIVKFSQGKAGWGDLLFAALDCIPMVGKIAMLAKAGRIGREVGLGLRVARAEQRFAGVIKVWRMGEDLKGFQKVAFAFGKGMGKDTLKDVMNGGWKDAKTNFLGNLVGNTVGVATGPLVDKGFSKIPRIVFRGDLSAMSSTTRRSLGHLSMDMNGKTDFGKRIIGGTKGLVTAVTKETITSTIFGQDFDVQRVGIGAATGIGDSGVGYQPGLSGARQYR